MENGGDLPRYFAHGIIWSVLMFLVTLMWAFILVALVIAGWLLGLVAGFALLFLLMGVVNSAIARWVWDIYTESGLMGNLLHGLFLFIVLIIVNIPGNLIAMLVPGPITVVVLFIVYCSIDGFVAKKIAAIIEGGGQVSVEEEPEDYFAPAERQLEKEFTSSRRESEDSF